MSTADEGEVEEAAKLVANERAKLFATYLNGLAVGIFVIGGVGPIFTYLFSAEATRPALALVVAGSFICQIGSAGLHLLARRPLRGLKP